MNVILFEDAAVANLEPLALTRPAFDLWCGAGPLLRRQLRYFGVKNAQARVRPALADLCRVQHPELTVNDPAPPSGEPVTLVNARWLAPVERMGDLDAPHVGTIDGQLAYAVVPRPGPDARWSDDLPRRLGEWRQRLPERPAEGSLIAYPWHLVEGNAEALRDDARLWERERQCAPVPEGVAVIGPRERLYLDPGATLEPLAVVDTTRGPVLVDRGAVVQAFSRLEGPCYVGEGTQIFAARLRGGTLGPQCRIGGEVESSIVQGFSNKYHEGFLGHSYVGEWVNFGAGTQVSDLRNDYGPVRLSIAGRSVDTGLPKVGGYFGDHTRTSIGTLFNTGTVAGPFCQLITSGTFLPRLLPAFCQYAHGQLQERNDLRQMVTTAAIVMERRGQKWTEAHEDFFFGLYEDTAEERSRVLRDIEQRRMRRVV
jgi:UDP-N-acetylglucosamine diphosphorylase/glucosamine-1-phosphate N-acetyltransferase